MKTPDIHESINPTAQTFADNMLIADPCSGGFNADHWPAIAELHEALPELTRTTQADAAQAIFESAIDLLRAGAKTENLVCLNDAYERLTGHTFLTQDAPIGIR